MINGPNLGLLGEREPGIYGIMSLEDINEQVTAAARGEDLAVQTMQSNHEGEIIDELHRLRRDVSGIIINAGAFTHYSYAIRDAISAVKLPCVEVHISNVHARDEFRRHSVIAPVCAGVICGFGANSYILAVKALSSIIKGY